MMAYLSSQESLSIYKEALKWLKHFSFDFSGQVNIYDYIRDLGVVLNFKPLSSKLSGVFIPSNDELQIPAGILINSNHPLSRQRFSAAHELYHFLFENNGDILVDFLPRESAIEDKEELKAELFASHFLMPEQLLRHHKRELGLKSIDEIGIYKLSCRTGTSYEAMCLHLCKNVKWIDFESYQKYCKQKPIDISKTIIQSNVLFTIKEMDNGKIITLTRNDPFYIELREEPSAGYIWQFSDCITPNIKIHNSEFIAYSDNPGSEGIRRITFQFFDINHFTIELFKSRPWETNDIDKNSHFIVHLLTDRFNGEYIPGNLFRELVA